LVWKIERVFSAHFARSQCQQMHVTLTRHNENRAKSTFGRSKLLALATRFVVVKSFRPITFYSALIPSRPSHGPPNGDSLSPASVTLTPSTMEYKEEDCETLPLFCVKTTEKRTGQTLYINFKSSDSIQGPAIDIEEDKIIQEICNPSPRIEQFKVPLRLGPIYWRATTNNHGDQICNSDKTKQDYVVDVELNDKFALRRVIVSEIIRHYVVTITMVSIEDKFNQVSGTKSGHQYIGHKLELDQANYKILDSKQQIERSTELVNNRILLVESSPSKGTQEKVPAGTQEDVCDPDDSSYDLYLRPKSMLLTCSIPTDSCPDSISFNDDRVLVELGDKTLLDVHLPLSIDLSVPAKYKFDDRLCLFRIVFKMAD
jgi:hypothetical protein